MISDVRRNPRPRVSAEKQRISQVIYAQMQVSENWEDWRFFLAVARHGSLSGAARHLGVNQSTVHRRIAHLEGAHEAQLFDRMPRGYALSPLGEAVLPAVERLEEEVLSIRRTVSGADASLRGTIRFTTVLELFECVAPALAAFCAQHPGIELDVSTSSRRLRLGRHEADVALRPGLAPTEPDVVGRRLRPSPLGVYAAASYLSERGAPTSLAELGGHDAIVVRERSLLEHAKRAVVVDTKMAQAAACRAGFGLADLPCFLGDRDPALRRLFVIEPGDVHLWILVHVDLRRAARVRAFVDWLEAALEEA